MRLREHPGILEGRNDVRFCKPDALTIEEGYNVRDLTTPQALQELDELEASVLEHGIQTPLKVRFDRVTERIIVVEGHRRLAVVGRLMAKFAESDGAAGRVIVSVPIIAEREGVTALDRDFALKHSNSGEKLKPLEFANLIYRTITQHSLSEEAAAKGFGVSLTVLRNHLKMRSELTDTVKEQVRQGDVSATLALKITRETRDAKTDPEFAAELIAANKAENLRIKGKKKRSTKVTAKTIKRDKEKAKPQPQAMPAPQASPPNASGGFTPPDFSDPELNAAPHINKGGHNPDVSQITERPAPPPPSNPQRNGVKELIGALKPFADLCNDFDANAKADDDLVEVFVRDVKRAWTVYTAATGGEEL